MKRGRAVYIITTLLISTGMIWVLMAIDTQEMLTTLIDADIERVGQIMLLYVLFNLTNGYVSNKLTLSTFGVQLDFKEWFGLSAVNTLANLILPLKAGTALKATYLKQKYGFELSRSVGALLFSSYISLLTILMTSTLIFFYLVTASAAINAAPWLATLPRSLPIILLTITALLTLISAMFFVLSRKSRFEIKHQNRPRIRRILSALAIMHESLYQLGKTPNIVCATVANAILNLSVNIAVLYLAFKAIAISPDLFGLTCLNLFNSASFYLSATPGNLGVQELTLSLSSMALGVSLEQGLAAAVLVRASSTLTTVVLGAIYFHKLNLVGLSSVLSKQSNKVL